MTSAAKLPAPPVPPDLDLRDMPIPRETFARMAVAEFGISYAEAMSFVVEAADRVEGGASRQVRRARQQAREAVAGLHMGRLQ